MRKQTLWALALISLLGSCKKTSVLEETTEAYEEELLSYSETDILDPVVSPPKQPAIKVNDVPMASPVAGPSTNLLPPPYLPPVPAVPPEAYGDDDAIDGFLDSPRIFGIPYSVCGNGTVEPKELCDDGNIINDDGCNVLCLLPICGNGLLELHEECDDNNTDSADGCTKDCLYEYCGNGRIDKLIYPLNATSTTAVYEECDDGNNKAGDGCSPCCFIEKCGNSLVEPGEECDDKETDCVCCKIVPPTTP